MPVYGKSAIYIYKNAFSWSIVTSLRNFLEAEILRPRDLATCLAFSCYVTHTEIYARTPKERYIYKNAFSGSTVTSLKIF